MHLSLMTLLCKASGGKASSDTHLLFLATYKSRSRVDKVSSMRYITGMTITNALSVVEIGKSTESIALELGSAVQ